eukprot:TRINITY_DN10795_c0_g1_i1.p1 TRINITY_DN10795_c0_g1~~TRINITY_DN10795_c0_g1_i1.p1  ORF type:complete len:334 (+),score=66.03 TRINITY_DN10795_c0_g1_i1:69-1004(+)
MNKLEEDLRKKWPQIKQWREKRSFKTEKEFENILQKEKLKVGSNAAWWKNPKNIAKPLQISLGQTERRMINLESIVAVYNYQAMTLAGALVIAKALPGNNKLETLRKDYPVLVCMCGPDHYVLIDGSHPVSICYPKEVYAEVIPFMIPISEMEQICQHVNPNTSNENQDNESHDTRVNKERVKAKSNGKKINKELNDNNTGEESDESNMEEESHEDETITTILVEVGHLIGEGIDLEVILMEDMVFVDFFQMTEGEITKVAKLLSQMGIDSSDKMTASTLRQYPQFWFPKATYVGNFGTKQNVKENSDQKM